jgi:hypothetical protein
MSSSAILQKLNELGFTNAEVTGERKGIFCVRVRTEKGWVYERFASAGAVPSWAVRHSPETDQ